MGTPGDIESPRQRRLIFARLPLQPGLTPHVDAGADFRRSEHDGVTAWLWGLPYFRDPALRTGSLARHWRQSPQRVLGGLDGAFLLLVLHPGGFTLVNDQVSPLTWYCHRRGGYLEVSNSLHHLMRTAPLPLAMDYHAYRHQIYTRNHHFNFCVQRGVGKLLKGHLLEPGLTPRCYYQLQPRIERGTTPADYFDHLRHYIRSTLCGRRVAILASNGYDSRMNCILLSECLDHFDIYTFRSDVYSEHRHARRFLRCLPRQNFTIHEVGHSMARGSPWYTPRRLAMHTDLFLDCFDDLTENKEHMLFLDPLTAMVERGCEVLITGCMGGDVRRVNPIHLIEDRPTDMDTAGTARTRELFGISDQDLYEFYQPHREDAAWLDDHRERYGDGQMNYVQPLLLNRGIAAVALPMATARSMEIYRGIDRTKLPGRGGVNFYREFIAASVPEAEPISFDTGIAIHVPLEMEPWLPRTVDLDLACRAMCEGGIDEQVLALLRNTYGIQSPSYHGTQAFLNLWAWFAATMNQRELFAASLEPLRRHDPYWHGQTWRAAALRGWDAARARWHATRHLGDTRHPLNRWGKMIRRAGRDVGYRVGSAGYGVARRLLGLPPWRELGATSHGAS